MWPHKNAENRTNHGIIVTFNKRKKGKKRYEKIFFIAHIHFYLSIK